MSLPSYTSPLSSLCSTVRHHRPNPPPFLADARNIRCAATPPSYVNVTSTFNTRTTYHRIVHSSTLTYHIFAAESDLAGLSISGPSRDFLSSLQTSPHNPNIQRPSNVHVSQERFVGGCIRRFLFRYQILTAISGCLDGYWSLLSL